MAPLKIDAPALVAFGAAILGYRVVLTLRFGLKARDIAMLSSEKIIQNINFVAVGAGLVNLYDFDRAQTLLREKGEGYSRAFTTATGAASVGRWEWCPRNPAPTHP